MIMHTPYYPHTHTHIQQPSLQQAQSPPSLQQQSLLQQHTGAALEGKVSHPVLDTIHPPPHSRDSDTMVHDGHGGHRGGEHAQHDDKNTEDGKENTKVNTNATTECSTNNTEYASRDGDGNGDGDGAQHAQHAKHGRPVSTVDPTVDVEMGTWEVQPGELTVCKDVLGKDVVLGKGGFSTVFKVCVCVCVCVCMCLGCVWGVYLGCVYQGCRKEKEPPFPQAKYRGGMYVAVKQMMVAPDDTPRMHSIIKEVAILRGVRSPHVVQFLGACQLPDRFLLVTELMEGGSLWTALQRGKVTWAKRGAAIALDTALGLHYLHSRNTLHLDLKSANVLLDRHGRAKIADVGVAQIRGNNDSFVQPGEAGTYAWAAPEVLMGERVGTTADVFSYGVVLWELITGEEPVRGCLRAVNAPEECSQQVAGLLKRCLGAAEQRPGMEEVIAVLRGVVGAGSRGGKGGEEETSPQHTGESKLSGAVSM